METIKHHVGYRILHDVEKTKRGIPQFAFKCDYCGRKTFKATLNEVRKRGKCPCHNSNGVKPNEIGTFRENIERKIELIDVKVVRRMAHYMPITSISKRFGVKVEDIMKIL